MLSFTILDLSLCNDVAQKKRLELLNRILLQVHIRLGISLSRLAFDTVI